MTRVLALDLSTAVGWAADVKDASADPSCPDRGVWRLPGFAADEAPLSFCRLNDLVEAAINVHRIDVVMYEDVLPGGATAKAFWLQKAQIGQAAIVERVATAMQREVYTAAVSSIRLHFCGSGRPRNKKKAVERACLQRGWMVGDHNAADACALWSYAKSILVPAAAAGLTPLFASPSRRREAVS